MRKPKRAKAYGDGTELDRFEDLPTDRDQESKFRVQAKGYGNRLSGGSVYPPKVQRPKSRAEDRAGERRWMTFKELPLMSITS
jgi:hypothetical protein